MNTQLANGKTIQVSIGNMELITSGAVHLNQTEFYFSVDSLNFGFSFKSDGTNVPRYQGRMMEGNRLMLDLFNHNNALGEGAFDPLEVGTLNGRRVFLTYFVNTVELNTNKRRVEFAIYLMRAI